MRWDVGGRLSHDTREALNSGILNALWAFVIFQYKSTNHSGRGELD